MAKKRLIDADALRQTMESNLYWGLDSDGAILDTIDDAPIVDAVEVVHGRWIHDSIGFDDFWKCSACGEDWFFIDDPTEEYTKVNYCPNCGAKKDGGS